ncbi:MAG TPA: response regulator [Methylomirabilota bacterium]|nr:response regulator [Methylomirabilota bacterium]
MTTMNENNNNNATILLVDNEPDNTCILSICLEDEGFKVDAFNDPVLALSNFKPNFYYLSILDINMPKMNGYELYKELRRLDKKVKVCFLTGSEVYYARLRIPPPEIVDYTKSFISKSLALDDLVKKIKKEIAS